jgi:chemotaxis response regulator CheB
MAQNEATSVAFGMPQKTILTGGVSSVLPLNEIPKKVCERI